MRGGRLTVAAGVAAATLLAFYLGAHAVDAQRVQQANRLGLAGRYEDALAEARRVRRAPAIARALRAEAVALTALGRYEPAVGAWRRVTAREPNAWVAHLGLARTLVLAGDGAGARAALVRAKGLNPRLRVPPELRSVAAAG